MRSPALCTLLLGALAALAAPAAQSGGAAPSLYMNNIAPFVYPQASGQRAGLEYELLDELIQRTGSGYRIAPLPFKRVRAHLDNTPNTLAAMWRLPENEANYQWIVKLADYDVVLAVRSDSTLDLSSPAVLRTLRVGVVLGGPAEVIARRQGFAHIEAAASAESNARKLALGRIDAWLAVPQVMEEGQRAIGIPASRLRIGARLGQVGIYLSCSLRCDQVDFNAWRSAAAGMKKDGSYRRIAARYHAAPQP